MSLAGKPLSHYRPRSPQVLPDPARARAMGKPPLWEFVILSMLLHTTAILLFGAPSGGSREGRAMWGALQVVLKGAPVDAVPSLKIDRGLASERSEAKAKPKVPRAAPAKRIEPQAPPLRAEQRVEPIAPPVAAPPAEPVPREVAPIAVPPLLDRVAAPERLPELLPFKVPPPTPVQAAPPPAPAVTPAPAPAPAEPAIEKRATPPVERAIAEPPPMSAPVVQPAPLPLPAPVPRIVTPAEIAPLASPVIPALAATPPVERPPVEIPALPVPTLETIAPARLEPMVKPVEITAPRETPVTVQPAPTPVPARTPAPAPAPQLQSREVPAKVDRAPVVAAEPAPQSSPFRPSLPSPDAIGNRTTEPSRNDATTAPALDLDAIRKRAGELARSGAGNRAVLPFPMPPVPERKSKIETALEKARKPDCRTAYANLGLAAVVPLIANEFGEGTCRW